MRKNKTRRINLNWNKVMFNLTKSTKITGFRANSWLFEQSNNRLRYNNVITIV